jgi:multifunctional methyltransferase subunit TRM112
VILLSVSIRRTKDGYPLIIEATTVVMEESPVDRELVTNMVNKIEYPALLQACQQLAPQCSSLPELPAELPDVLDDALVATLHTVLFDIHVTEGHLICPGTGRKFTIKEGRSITIY